MQNKWCQFKRQDWVPLAGQNWICLSESLRVLLLGKQALPSASSNLGLAPPADWLFGALTAEIVSEWEVVSFRKGQLKHKVGIRNGRWIASAIHLPWNHAKATGINHMLTRANKTFYMTKTLQLSKTVCRCLSLDHWSLSIAWVSFQGGTESWTKGNRNWQEWRQGSLLMTLGVP